MEKQEKLLFDSVMNAQKLNREFMIILRGDSTLRGHYPEETKKIKILGNVGETNTLKEIVRVLTDEI